MSRRRVRTEISLRRGWLIQIAVFVVSLIVAAGVAIGEVRFGAGFSCVPLVAAVDLVLWKTYALEIDGEDVVVKKLLRTQHLTRSQAYFRDRLGDGLWMRERGAMRMLSAHLCWDFGAGNDRVGREIEAAGFTINPGE